MDQINKRQRSGACFPGLGNRLGFDTWIAD
jgi:hypothetical protein